MFLYVLGLIPVYFFVSNLWSSSNTSGLTPYDFNSSLFIPLNDSQNITCPRHKYNTYLISSEPLIMYIEGFLSPEESEHLVEISDSEWEKSVVWSGENQDPKTDTTVRISETALIPRTVMVQCIEERALAIQGWRKGLHLERLRTQKYEAGGHYVHHFDWKGGRGADRVSSFMVYVEADCEGGGTNFPRIEKASAKWCDMGFVDCEKEVDENVDVTEQVEGNHGVTFKPMKGNAVFWENLRSDGSGYDETWHAGLPVLNGSKIGLNIWTWAVPR